MSLVIRGGRVLAGTPPTVTRADILIDGERITAVGVDLAAPEDAREIDARQH